MAARHAFVPAGEVPFTVDFEDDDSMRRYRAARDWCDENCSRRWSADAERQVRRAVFAFEDHVDAVHFALCWT